MTLEEIAMRLSLTRERVRQIELGALKKLWARLAADEIERKGSEPAPGFRRPARIAA
jgi:DNA-directed RNA polymerase sigma subunit (sigma70/sigma32)